MQESNLISQLERDRRRREELLMLRKSTQQLDILSDQTSVQNQAKNSSLKFKYQQNIQEKSDTHSPSISKNQITERENNFNQSISGMLTGILKTNQEQTLSITNQFKTINSEIINNKSYKKSNKNFVEEQKNDFIQNELFPDSQRDQDPVQPQIQSQFSKVGESFSQSKYLNAIDDSSNMFIQNQESLDTSKQQKSVQRKSTENKKDLSRTQKSPLGRENSYSSLPKSIQLRNMKETGSSQTDLLITSKYDQNPEECHKLSEHILKNKRFILCFGQNKDGELGLGNFKESYGDIRAIQIQNEQFNSALSISCGSHHSVLVTKSGEIYVCGSSLHGKLGLKDLEITNLNKFTQIYEPQKFVVQVACGDYHNLALTKDGLVYSWGGSLHKKAQGGNIPVVVEQLVQMKARVIQVECGDFHSVALDQTGRIFSWGGGGASYNKGQCGHGHFKDTEIPEQIQDLSNVAIIQISAGGYHTLALSHDNNLYSWGSGQYGECGQGQFQESSKPLKIKLSVEKGDQLERNNFKSQNGQSTIKQISAGGHHSMILTQSGKLYTFGYGQHGQLGLRKNNNLCVPTLVKDLLQKPIQQIAAGWNHSLVLTQQGDLYACGYGQYGQLGQGNDNESKSKFHHVAQLGPRKIYKIFAGGNHSWVVLDDIIPVREKYRVPSPIPEKQNSNTRSPSNNENEKQKQVAVQKPLQQNKNRIDFEIDVTYSPDSHMIHRFINFEISSKNHEKVFVALQNYIAQIEIDDQGGFMYHQIQEQYEQNLSQGIIRSSKEFRPKVHQKKEEEKQFEYEKQITVAMIMSPECLHENSLLRKQIQNSILNTSAISDMNLETESKYKSLNNYEIQYREKEGIQFENSLAKWILLFYKLMNYSNTSQSLLLYQPRFSEIRPMSFYIF